MRPYPLTVLNGGINRLRVKGGASASQLYDLQNAYITNAGSIVPREGTTRTATLNTATVGLAAANGTFNIFSSTYTTVGIPTGYTLNVLQDPVNTSASVTKIWFAKPFMGFEYVVAQFSDGLTFHYWLQNDGTWASNTVYTTASIVLPPIATGLAYQGVQDQFLSTPVWTPNTVIASASFILPNTPNGFAYRAISTAGSPAHTGATEPVWPITSGAIIQEFGDFDQSTSDGGTNNGVYSTAPNLATSITDKYGDSATISNSGVFVSSIGTLSTLTLASTKVKTWVAGTTYPSGSVVIPTTNQGAVTDAIPQGDFSGGASQWVFSDAGGLANWAPGSGLPFIVGGADIEIANNSLGADGAYATMFTSASVTPGMSITLSATVDPNNSGANGVIWIQLNWYDATNTLISFARSGGAEGGGYRLLTVTGVAPSKAAGVRAAIRFGSGTAFNTAYVGLIKWSLQKPAAITNFLFEAVQPAPGISAATEPTWPTTLGLEVIDGTVTWQAIGTSIIDWEAIPTMLSGISTPSFPTTVGLAVNDPSNFTDTNGAVVITSMSWIAINRAVLDTNNPQTPAVTIGASHVFAGNNDIVDYSAAVNPIDWTSTNNAGYLPTGLNNYGDNPVTALGLYRGNLMVFNAGGYQMWQIDPDPQNMAFLDAQAVGCIWTRSIQSIANDLIFLTEVGVRNLGTIGATANMAIGNTGQPADPLIVAQMQAATYDPFTIYYPGRGQYWLIYGPQAFVLTINGLQGNKSWSRYIFPQVITDATLNSGSLYLRTSAGLVWQLYAPIGYDDKTISSLSFDPNNQLLLTLNGNISDSSMSSATGTLNNGAITTSTGGSPFGSAPAALSVGGALLTSFTSTNPPTSCVSLSYPIGTAPGDVPNVTAGTDFTIEGWFQLTNNDPLYHFIVFDYGHYAYSGPGSGLVLSVIQGTGTGTVSLTADASGWGSIAALTSNTITTGAWYHFAVVRHSNNGSLYINGGLQNAPSNNWIGQANCGLLSLGCSMAKGVFGVGYVSEVRISNTARYTASFVPPTVPFSAGTTISSASINIISTVQWPYIDMGGLGLNKMLIGVDLVGEGAVTMQIAFDQQDKSTFVDNVNFATSTGVTAPYFLAIDDTVPGEPLPIPINAPSYSLILTFDGGTIATPNVWQWEAANFYLAPQGGGGVTG